MHKSDSKATRPRLRSLKIYSHFFDVWRLLKLRQSTLTTIFPFLNLSEVITRLVKQCKSAAILGKDSTWMGDPKLGLVICKMSNHALFSDFPKNNLATVEEKAMVGQNSQTVLWLTAETQESQRGGWQQFLLFWCLSFTQNWSSSYLNSTLEFLPNIRKKLIEGNFHPTYLT